MIHVRRSADRGHFDHGWLDTFHTFSFADYHDERFMGFRALRVINEDRVAPGDGFGSHGHRDMEIITWVLEGSLRHQDSMGNGDVIVPGEAQRMTAGTGVTHSEQNASAKDPVHLLQIWILPERRGLTPGYEQKAFPEAARRGKFAVVASADGRDGSVTVHQDVTLLDGLIEPGQRVAHALAPGRHAWVQVARGAITLDAGEGAPVELAAGDGAAVSPDGASGAAKARTLTLAADAPAEVLVFDLA
jgi:redox-sensitive bicupin YhaK (pirin superfamily)